MSPDSRTYICRSVKLEWANVSFAQNENGNLLLFPIPRKLIWPFGAINQLYMYSYFITTIKAILGTQPIWFIEADKKISMPPKIHGYFWRQSISFHRHSKILSPLKIRITSRCNAIEAQPTWPISVYIHGRNPSTFIYLPPNAASSHHLSVLSISQRRLLSLPLPFPIFSLPRLLPFVSK